MIREDEVIDDLQRNGLKILQKKEGFKFGIDAVLLANFAQLTAGKKVLDIGTGTGIIPLLLTAKVKNLSIDAIELQEDMAEMASRSVAINQLEEHIQIIQGDSMTYPLRKSSYDVILSNPPYFKKGAAIINPHDGKAIARHEITMTIESLLERVATLLKPRGTFYLVHRPDRLVDIFAAMRQYGIEPKVIRLVQPRIDKGANLVLLKGVRDGKPELRWMPPLQVYQENGDYSAEIYQIYQEQGLDVFERSI